jgi:peptidoglycan/xylan/chitin deacetylase (PgdA/CDA1 family)
MNTLEIDSCKIIMYHYIRPIKNSHYPKINGLEIKEFEKQITFFEKKFNFISGEEIIDLIYENKSIPKNSIILTFDDGFNDHFSNVFPILKKKQIQGLFFPSLKPIIEKKVLDVHKIHFILEKNKNRKELLIIIQQLIQSKKKKFSLKDPEKYLDFPNFSKYDNRETALIKKILQINLPEKARNEITDDLFKKIIHDEKDFAEKLYLSLDQILEMQESGMFFGSHGYKHEWLSNLTDNELNNELIESLKFLKKIKQDKKIMCYPYGDYNEKVIKKIKEKNYKIGLTAESGDAELSIRNAFKLKRYDTNDFLQ